MTTTSDGAKESSKKKKVVTRLLSGVGQSHGAVDNGVEVWLRERERENIGRREGGTKAYSSILI